MSFLNLAWRVLAAVTVMVTGPAVMGQVFHPFAEKLDVDPDWQFFAPVDVDSLTELSPRKRASTGWFATYDRTNLWVARAQTEASADRGDFGWGNRFDIGFMTSKRSGWLAGFRTIGGPNVYDRVSVTRIDNQNANDTGDPTNPVFPPELRNDPQLGYRVYVLGDSLNVVSMTGFELNKTWRLTPYRYGGILEPMIGFKYTTLKDTALNESYTRNNVTLDGSAPPATTNTEHLRSLTTNITNQMVGGQLGARYFTHANRWTLSGEFRAFALANFQDRRAVDRTISTQYSGIGGTVTISDFHSVNNTVYDTNSEFVFGFEARAQAAYQLTKSFNIRAGIEVIDFAQGIWRGANAGFGNQTLHDQDVLMAGFTFGLSLNR